MIGDGGHILALDTATDIASVGIVDISSGEAIAELEAQPGALFAGLDALLEAAGIERPAVRGVVVGVGPGRYTSLRIGLAGAKGLATALGIPVAGVSTLDALAAGAVGAVAMIDARRGEVFTRTNELVCVLPEDVPVEGRLCVGDGAIAYRAELEARGAEIPDERDSRHRVQPACLAQIARAYGEPSLLEPVYLRVPDAERTRKEFPRA